MSSPAVRSRTLTINCGSYFQVVLVISLVLKLDVYLLSIDYVARSFEASQSLAGLHRHDTEIIAITSTAALSTSMILQAFAAGDVVDLRTKKPASDGETPKRVFRSIAVMKWP